jgi:hypothetical protein
LILQSYTNEKIIENTYVKLLTKAPVIRFVVVLFVLVLGLVLVYVCGGGVGVGGGGGGGGGGGCGRGGKNDNQLMPSILVFHIIFLQKTLPAEK